MSKKTRERESLGVRSRMSWGAIFAGFFVALVTLAVLTTFGTAVRLSFISSGGEAASAEVSTGTMIYRIFVALTSLFAGGWATSQFVTRETRREAMFYGVVLWGVCFLALMIMTVNGLEIGLGRIMGVTNIFDNYLSNLELRRAAETLGLSPEQVTIFEDMLRQHLEDTHATRNTWWSLLGLVLSIGATVLGAFMGSGMQQDGPNEWGRTRLSPVHRIRL